MFLQFLSRQATFLGSLFTYLRVYHTVMPISRIDSPEIPTVLSHIKQQTYSSKGQICFCLLSATTDINLVSLHETAQLLLSYILSHHSRLTQIRSSPTVMHTNNSRNSYVGSLPVHWTNVFLTSVYTNTYSYDTVCISKSRLSTLSLLRPRNSTGLPDIKLCLEHIS